MGGRVLLGCLGILALFTASADAVPISVASSIERILQRPALDGAQVGIEIRSLRDGRSIYSHQSQDSFIPASNQKLLTIALALDQLGPDFQFETPLIATGGVHGGIIRGDLWVVGSGDPSLAPRYQDSGNPESGVRRFVDALTMQGIRGIEGDLVVDATLFDDEGTAPGWPSDQLDQDYCAPVGALSLNSNCLEVVVTSSPSGSPKVSLRPETRSYRPVSHVATSTSSREMMVWLIRPDREGRVQVRGKVGPQAGTARFQLPVRDPALFFGRSLYAGLLREGVFVNGNVRHRAANEPRPETRPLYVCKSPLLPPAYVCGKESDNLVAEHLLKKCASESEEVGTFAGGARLCRSFLQSLGADVSGFQMTDGSGLSRENRVTPKLLVDLLAAMYDSPLREPYLRSLPISGIDGTLSKRMTEPDLCYRVRAKTGYLLRVSGLSGYVDTGERESPKILAFSILINGFRGSNRDMKKVQDDICRALIEASP